MLTAAMLVHKEEVLQHSVHGDVAVGRRRHAGIGPGLAAVAAVAASTCVAILSALAPGKSMPMEAVEVMVPVSAEAMAVLVVFASITTPYPVFLRQLPTQSTSTRPLW